MKYLVALALILSGCVNHHMTGYDIGVNSGQTIEDSGTSYYTGASFKAHFDVRK